VSMLFFFFLWPLEQIAMHIVQEITSRLVIKRQTRSPAPAEMRSDIIKEHQEKLVRTATHSDLVLKLCLLPRNEEVSLWVQ
jgi:hypothetical protein